MSRDTELRNPGHDDRWTCPACYKDLPNRTQGTFKCECGANVDCSLDSQPVCVSRIDEPEEV